MVNVFEGERIIARVKYTQNLDHWDGHNYTCGATERHLGLAKLKDGRYVLIHGTQWQGEEDYSEIITEDEALQEILKSHNDELLDDEFKELKELGIEQGLIEA